MDDRLSAILRWGCVAFLLGAAGVSAQPPAPPEPVGSLEDEIIEWVGPFAPVDAAERAAREFTRAHPHLGSVFELGERLVFSVRYGPIRAGEATMAIRGIAVVGGDS